METVDDNLEELRKLYPGVTDEELRVVATSLNAYVEVALRIYERIEENPEAHTLLKALFAERRNGKTL